MLHAKRLDNLWIGNALISPTGYRIDHIQPSDNETTCFSVSYRGSLLYLSASKKPDAIAHLLAWLSTIKMPVRNKADKLEYERPGDEWTLERSGGDDLLPLWDLRLRVLSIVDPHLLFTPSPYTGELRSQVTLPRKRSDHANPHTNAIHTVTTLRHRGNRTTREAQFEVGTVYAIKELSQNKERQYDVYGYVRLVAIAESRIGQLTDDDLVDEGYGDFTQWAAAWEACKLGKFDDARKVWLLKFARVHSPIVPPCPRWPTLPKPARPRQMKLMLAEA